MQFKSNYRRLAENQGQLVMENNLNRKETNNSHLLSGN
jgi:hypothetical protein